MLRRRLALASLFGSVVVANVSEATLEMAEWEAAERLMNKLLKNLVSLN